jgi:hypothetical protein
VALLDRTLHPGKAKGRCILLESTFHALDRQRALQAMALLLLHNNLLLMLMAPFRQLLGLSAKYVAKLVTRPLIVSTEWTIHIREDIPRLNCQPWWLTLTTPMMISSGLLTAEPTPTSPTSWKICLFSSNHFREMRQ